MDGFRPRLLVLARLGERAGAAPPSFAAEEAVEAVAEAGRRTGLVGDFGRTLLSGEVFTAFFATLLDDASGGGWRGLATWAVDVVEANEVRLGFLAGGLLVSLGVIGCLGEAVFERGCLLGVTGVFGVCGVVGDLTAVVTGEGFEESLVTVASCEVEIAAGREFSGLLLDSADFLGCLVSAALPYAGVLPPMTFEGDFTNSGFCGDSGSAECCFSAGGASNADPFSRDPRFSAS